MVIDFHTHAFPDKIAEGAIGHLARGGGGLIPATDGTAAGLARLMRARGVDRFALLPVATKASQQASICRWASERREEGLIAFGSVFPDAPDALETAEEIARLGLKGVKFHPEYQSFDPGCEKYGPLYRKIASLGLITVFHAGLDVGYRPPCRGTPEAIARALPYFDGAPVVAAHFGGYMLWDRVPAAYKGLPIYVDTAYSHSHVIVPQICDILEALGCDRVLFGSDAPWGDPAREKMLLDALPLSDGERAMILGGNAARLLGL